MLRTVRSFRPRGLGSLVVAAFLCLGFVGAPTEARQPVSAVYVDDAPSAEEALGRAADLAAVGNLDEAAEVLQGVLDESTGAVIASPGDPDLFVAIRGHVHAMLLADPELLARYRERERATAEALLATEQLERVETTRLLTAAGADATLRLAQRRLAGAHFAAARHLLAQLDAHPDRAGARAEAALALLELVAAYTPEASADLLVRWRAEAGRPAGPPVAAERPARSERLTHAMPGGPVDLEGVLPRPLASARIGGGLELIDSLVRAADVRALPESALVLHAVPVVAGDAIYVNDSETISAWDRITLRPRWSVRIEAAPSSSSVGNGAWGLDDVNTVTVAEGRVVAVTGLSLRGRGTAERNVVAIDADSGQVLWRRSIPDLGDQDLIGGVFRGVPIVDQGVVVLSVIKHLVHQRVIGVYMLGLDIETGARRWVRPIASIGSLPFGWHTSATDSPVALDGIVYRTDHIGVISAVESATGRTRWIRRVRSGSDAASRGMAWQGNRPLVADGLLYTIGPSRERLLAVDPESGRIVRAARRSLFGDPEYLLATDDELIGIAHAEIVAQPLEHFGTDRGVRTVRRYPSAVVRGRVLLAGDELIVPTRDGLEIVAVSATADDDPDEVRLAAPGHVVAADGQLVVVDDALVHTYARWNVAEQHLTAKMREVPTDPGPAIRLAELSYQAEQVASILPAIDHALEAIGADPLLETNDAARGRLFDSLLQMVEPEDPASAPLTTHGVELRADVLDRLALAAATPEERVAHLMASGQFHEARGRTDLAVADYQRALESPELAAAQYVRGSASASAAAEATRRIRRIVRIEGREVYGRFDDEAEHALAAAESLGTADAYESIARRYPVSRAAPRAWGRASELYARQGRLPLASFAIEEASLAAELVLPPGAPEQTVLARRSVELLLEQGRLDAAVVRLDRFAASGREMQVTVGSRTLAIEEALRAVQAELQRASSRPAIGTRLSAGETIADWIVADLPDGRGDTAPQDRVLMEHADGTAGMWAIGEDGTMELVWRGAEGEFPEHMDGERVFFSRATSLDGRAGDSKVLRCRSLETGELLWETPGFAELFGEAVRGRVASTPGPAIRLDTLFYKFDGRLLLVVERSGRGAAFDVESGEVLWRFDGPLDVVQDLDLRGGLAVVAGSIFREGQIADHRHRPEERQSVSLVIEAWSGRILHRHVDPEPVRWARMTPAGTAVIGVDAGLVCVDGLRGVVLWRQEDRVLQSSHAGVTLPGRILVRDYDNRIWQINSASGELRSEPLDVRGRLDRGFVTIQVEPLGALLGLATGWGVAIIDTEGELVGVDVRTDGRGVRPAVFARDQFVHVTRNGEPVPDDPQRERFLLRVYDLPTGKLAARLHVDLASDVARFTVIDDRILVSSYRNTLVIKAERTDDP